MLRTKPCPPRAEVDAFLAAKDPSATVGYGLKYPCPLEVLVGGMTGVPKGKGIGHWAWQFMAEIDRRFKNQPVPAGEALAILRAIPEGDD